MGNDNKIAQALKAATETAALETGIGILPRAGKMFGEQFPGQKALVVADPNTYAAAGGRVFEYLRSEGIECDIPYIFDAADLHAEWKFVDMLDGVLSSTDAVAVAVGSGTINDLAKLSSAHCRKSYMCVGTAASVDGYTSFGASITYRGAKQTFECPAPRAVLADALVMADAPYPMTAAGYADLAAKTTAGADWILADALGLDPIHPVAFDMVQDGLKDSLADPEGIARRDPHALIPLIDGLMLSGFAMQASRSSRPASGAEHMFSHLWDMEHHEFHGEIPSHGFKVAIGTLALTALYERMFATGFDDLDIERRVSQWPSLEEVQRSTRELFAGKDYAEKCVVEMTAKYPDRDELRRELTFLKQNWRELFDLLRVPLLTFGELSRRLEIVGAPTTPEQIGISRRRLRDSYLPEQHLRRRFMLPDLAVRTGYLERWLDGIFGPEGVFGGCFNFTTEEI